MVLLLIALELRRRRREHNDQTTRRTYPYLKPVFVFVWGGCGWCSESIFASILEASSLALEIIIVTTIIVHPGSVSAAEGIALWAATAAASSLLVLLRAIVVEA